MDFSNKNNLINWWCTGIGKSIAEIFSKNGAKVIIIDIDQKLGNEIVSQLQNVEYFNLDLSKQNQISNYLKSIRDIQIDVFIGNAGILSYKNLSNFNFEDAHDIFNTNLLDI